MPPAPATFAAPAPLSRLPGRLGLAGFAVFLVVGVLTRLNSNPARELIGAAVGLGAGAPLFLVRSRFALGCAAVSTVGVALGCNADAHDIGWFAVIVLAAWCVLSGGVLVGTVYWAAAALLFGGEWLWAVRDAGWAPWTAGLTVTVLASALIRHELILVERLRAVQADLAERSRAEERNRIARELHDVIAHTLTVSLLHVSSARLAVEHDPADAVRALAEAERLGRQSLAEVRATMGLLRQPGPEAPKSDHFAPVPALDQLPRLVDELRQTGADIGLHVDGETGYLPATVGTTIYRIVQEALTNATKHAPGAAVMVEVTATRGAVEVFIDSAGALERLTSRELEVLALIGKGHTNTEIAQYLFVGEGTVKTHVNHVFTKLDLRDRAAAVVFAYDHNLVAGHG